MKVAIVYSTQLRTGIRCIENHRRFIGDLDFDVFAHIWAFNTSRLYEDPQYIPYSEIEKYLGLIKAKHFQIEHDFMEFPKSLYYSWARSVQLKREWEIENGIQYDIVVKLRPDVIFPPNRFLKDEIRKVASHTNVFLVEWLKPNWNEPEGLCDDVLWVTTNGIMDFAASYYDYDYRTGGNKTPQKSLARFLHHNGIEVTNTVGHAIEGGFCIYRPEASHLCPMSQFRECLEFGERLYDDPPKKPGSPDY